MKTEDMTINIFDENGGLRDKETVLKEMAKVYDDLAEEQKSIESEFSKVTPTFINGSIRKLERTNLTYIEPHRVIIKNITFLVFNYSNDIYITNLTKKIKLSELEEYLKNI